jgi:Secretion system C-terminal sorting domain
MKKTLLLTFLFPVLAFSQSLTPEVVSNGGDDFVGGTAQLSWTLGEVAITNYYGTSNQLTEGYQQCQCFGCGNVDLEEIEVIQANIYPNPVNSNLIVEFSDNEELLEIIIYDALGRVVLTDIYSGNGPKNIQTSTLSAGTYTLHATSNHETIYRTKIIKK